MSSLSNNFSTSEQASPLRQKNHTPQKTSMEQVDSDVSVKSESTKASLTPPTSHEDLNHSSSEDDGEGDLKDQEADSLSDSDDHQKKKEVVIDPICAGEADGQCTLNSGDHRKVTSHVFGRNKRETHQIPEECWIKYCRKHYQRQKYRCPAEWFETQLLLVDGQLDRLEAWGGVIDWTIQLRKKEREAVDRENNHQAIHGSLPDGPLSRERFLLPYLGANKTFAEVREVVNVINKECDDTHNLTLPSFEFLPRIDERRNPRPRRGAGRRSARPSPAQRTPTTTSTFRLAPDKSGHLTKIETKPRLAPSSDYTQAKGRTLAKKRSSSALKAEDTPEPSSRTQAKKRRLSALKVDETPEPSSHISKKHKSNFQAIKKQAPPSSEVVNQLFVDHVERLAEPSVSPLPNDKGKNDIDVSKVSSRPVKRHRRSRSL
ncbi:MAG: hypothetical protein Q9221_003649 [Calogaya cf. arnoldii]